MEPIMTKPDATTDLRPNILVIPLTDAAGIKFWKNEIFQEQSIALAHKVIDKIAADRDRLAKELVGANAVADSCAGAEIRLEERETELATIIADRDRLAKERDEAALEIERLRGVVERDPNVFMITCRDGEHQRLIIAAGDAEGKLDAAVYRAEKAEAELIVARLRRGAR